jgi:hypothetical protein
MGYETMKKGGRLAALYLHTLTETNPVMKRLC